MALDVFTQISQQFSIAQSILIALPETASTDALASALILRSILRSQNKNVDVVCAGFVVPQKLGFLQDIKSVINTVPALYKSVIKINTQQVPVAGIDYQQHDHELRILLTPEHGAIQSAAISLHESHPVYDIVVTINASDLASLGDLFLSNTKFFFGTPIINIDHSPQNELFGHINLVDIQATSTTELLYNQYFFAKDQLPDAALAQTILAGMMDETNSFRSVRVHPQTLAMVGSLIKAGADYQNVVDHLYRSKSVGLLKLWGHTLNHLQSDLTHNLVWSLIPASVFSTTGTDPRQLEELMQEIIQHSPNAKTVVLFFQHPKSTEQTEIVVTTQPPLNAKDLIKEWQLHGHDEQAFGRIANGNMHAVEQEVLSVIKLRLKSIWY